MGQTRRKRCPNAKPKHSTRCSDGYKEKDGCCMKCGGRCRPGEERKDGCLDECTPCEQKPFPTFSNGDRCLQCKPCKSLGMITLEVCTPEKNSKCSDGCKEGYILSSGACVRGRNKPVTSQSPLMTPGGNTSFGQPLQNIQPPVNNSPTAMAVLVGLCGFAVVILVITLIIIMKCKTRNNGNSCESRTPDSSHQDNDASRNTTEFQDLNPTNERHDQVQVDSHIYSTVDEENEIEQNQLNSLKQKSNHQHLSETKPLVNGALPQHGHKDTHKLPA